MKESVKIDAALVGKVRKKIKKTKHTIGGFFELSTETFLTINPEHIKMWKEKAEKWDKLGEKIAEFYPEDSEGYEGGDLTDIGEAAAMAFGFL